MEAKYFFEGVHFLFGESWMGVRRQLWVCGPFASLRGAGEGESGAAGAGHRQPPTPGLGPEASAVPRPLPQDSGGRPGAAPAPSASAQSGEDGPHRAAVPPGLPSSSVRAVWAAHKTGLVARIPMQWKGLPTPFFRFKQFKGWVLPTICSAGRYTVEWRGQPSPSQQ